MCRYAVEDAFSQLAQGKVDVPLPMHIGINETAAAGPGDCHVKGGYIEGAPTWTVKLANVSFYNNVAKGLPAGSGVFVVCDAATGGPKAILHENRYLTDLRTGAAAGLVTFHHVILQSKHEVKTRSDGSMDDTWYVSCNNQSDTRE